MTITRRATTSHPTGFTLMLAGLHRVLGPDPRRLVEIARVADAVGIDELLIGDHVVMGDRADRYPYGTFAYGPEDPIRPGEPWHEVLTLLAAISTATSRIRLTPGVLLAPLRRAVSLAKVAATLDQLCGGRLTLGVGTGWQREEYAALGVAWADRWQILDETMRACRVLWRDAPASFESKSVSFERIWCAPRPVQDPLPVLIGARLDEPRLAMAAAWADGWLPLGLGLDQVRDGIARLRGAFAAAGRDASRLHVPVMVGPPSSREGGPDPEATLEAVHAVAEAGGTSAWFVVSPGTGCTSMAEIVRYVEALGALRHR